MQKKKHKKELSWNDRVLSTNLLLAETKLEEYKNKIEEQYGHCADPTQATWKNVQTYILKMTPRNVYARPTNHTSHEYYRLKPMPPSSRSLLGLRYKFCPTRPRPKNNVNKTIDRFKKDVRRIAFFGDKPPDECKGIHYIPTFNIKNGM